MNTDPKKILPEIKGAHTGVVYLRVIPDQFKVIIRMWDGATPRQEYALRILGSIDEDGVGHDQLVYSDILTRGDIEKGELEITLYKSLLLRLIDQQYFLLKFSVKINGVETRFAGSRYMLKHDHTDLTNFSTGQLEGWALGPEIQPGDVTFVEHEGKKCLFYNPDEKVSRKVIISRTFNLVEGRRYMLNVGVFVPPAQPLKFVIIILKEGQRSTYWAFSSGLERALPIELGITAKSASTTVEILTDDEVGPYSPFMLTDIGVSEHNPLRPWDPEWDIEWEPGGDHPVKEPHSDSPDL
ncbi:hypothetical protein [Pseudomonas putida]|uniref:hypothetical protein n=1 Tax=Pseudomonas putida TaxID=303 RepID=UPI003D9601F5